jgi:hypothetical protein
MSGRSLVQIQTSQLAIIRVFQWLARREQAHLFELFISFVSSVVPQTLAIDMSHIKKDLPLLDQSRIPFVFD